MVFKKNDRSLKGNNKRKLPNKQWLVIIASPLILLLGASYNLYNSDGDDIYTDFNNDTPNAYAHVHDVHAPTFVQEPKANDARPASLSDITATVTSKEKTGTVRVREGIHRKLHSDGIAIGQHEMIFTHTVAGLLREKDLLPEGSVLDCGAQFGEQGAHYAVTCPECHVIAMDPSPNNVQKMKDSFGSLSNLDIRQGALADEVGSMKPRDNSFQMSKDEEFPVYTLDSMFFDKGLKLGFAHLDLEGFELKALKGGVKTIQAYKPVFTVELRVHDTKNTKELLNYIDYIGYDSYVIFESCGFPHLDVHNVINIPRQMSKKFGNSDIFSTLIGLQGGDRITADTIAERVLPCCALGGECCPGDDLEALDCCSDKLVFAWHKKNNIPYNEFTLGWKGARVRFLKKGYRENQRQKLP